MPDMLALSIFLVVSTIPSYMATVSYAVLSKSMASPQIYVTSNQSSIAAYTDSPDWIAYAEYSPSSDHASNFAQLLLRTNGQYPDKDQTYAAGYLEGYLTAESIHQHYFNMLCQVDCSGNVSQELTNFFREQDAWAHKQVKENLDCPFWTYIGTLLSQVDGVMDGYHASDEWKEHPLTPWAFTMINAMGDLFDIIPAVSKSKRPLFDKMSLEQLRQYSNKNGHCSALIRITPGIEEVFVGHTSWFTYSAMLRIMKSYEFNLHNVASRAKKTVFSSYPGTLSSLDDMYLMSGSDLVMTQTTNSIYNHSLWDLVVPQSLLAWQRVRAANQLSDSGPEWFKVVGTHNSGTYNNQYMILDLKLFKPLNALPVNTLFVVEQIPGLVQGADVTAQLERGYWSSYNVPYHQDVYVQSGYGLLDKLSRHALFTEYQQAPRAKIFRRDHSNAVDLESMQYLMRYNKFQTDSYANGDPWAAIAARGDLSAISPYAGGGYDTKITSDQMFFRNLQSSVVNGPTSVDQAPFRWSTSNLTDSHLGQPDVFDFQFEQVSL